MSSKKCTLILHLATTAGLQAALVNAYAAPAGPAWPASAQSPPSALSAPRPDALLAIDMNRSAVVEKIFASWAADIPSAQQAAFKSKLGALRADELLSASMSPSVDGVLEIIHVSKHIPNESSPALGSAQTFYAAQSELKNGAVNSAIPAAQNSNFSRQSSENLGAEQSKTLGDANADLVYTPLVPCRLFDTRTGLASALGTVGGTYSNQQTRTITPAGACGIPTSGVASLFLSFHSYNNNPSTLGVIGFMAPGTAFSALAATWTGGAWATGTYITRTNPNGSFDAFVGNNQAMTADLIVDVMGYFRAPSGTIGDITDIQTAAGSGLSGGVTSGAVSLSLATGYKLPQACASGQVPKSDGAGNWACAADATGASVTNAWTQGGNAFGAPGVIATTDTQSMTLRAGGVSANVLVSAQGDGLRISAAAPSPTSSYRAPNVVNGSNVNDVAFRVVGATIAGGGGVRIAGSGADFINGVDGDFGTVGGGSVNLAGVYGTVAGGSENIASGFSSVVSGGGGNRATGSDSVISGGFTNRAQNAYATVAGGQDNTASGLLSTVAGGGGNTASGFGSFVAGGQTNSASANFGFAAGFGARADQANCAILNFWVTGTASGCAAQNGIVRVFANKGFTVDFGTPDAAGNGSDWVFIGPIFAGKSIQTKSGAHLTVGGVWTNMSDRAAKESFRKIDAQAVLRKVAQLPITTWNYISEGKDVRRMGPMAQDFRKAFGLGLDETSIGAVDADGVALVAIQGLNQKLDAKELKIQSLERELYAIKKKFGL